MKYLVKVKQTLIYEIPVIALDKMGARIAAKQAALAHPEIPEPFVKGWQDTETLMVNEVVDG